MRTPLLPTLITYVLAFSVQAQYGSSAAGDFVPPRIEVIDPDYGATFGAQLFRELIPDPETFIRDACAQVCQVLYDRFEDAPRVTDLTYYLEDYDGISVTWGPRPHVYVKYSTRWIQSTWQNNGGDNGAVLYETTGVLCHELTHAYQQNGNQIPVRAVEGIADAVRTALARIFHRVSVFLGRQMA